MPASYLQQFGVSWYTWKWLPSDVASMWASFDCPADMCLFLRNIGFTHDEVLEPILPLISMVPQAAEELSAPWAVQRLPELAYAVMVFLGRVLPNSALCDLVRQHFSLDRMAEKLQEALSNDTVTA